MVKLTAYSHGSGWACKLAPDELAQVLRPLSNTAAATHRDLLVGIDGSDDAGVYRISDEVALVQSVDYFTPVVDDPGDWGRIAAVNALSDIYAMGGTPLTALQIVGWPRETLSFDLLTEVLQGAASVLADAGCTLVGGHSLDDPEPKFGLAVTGTVHPDRIVTNAGAESGNALVLTKPLGTGIISTALKQGTAPDGLVEEATRWMTTLNATARDAMLDARAAAATDVTGFGLLGHLGEMLAASGVGADLYLDAVPTLEGVRDLIAAGRVPGGTKRNLRHAEAFTDFGAADDVDKLLLADAQTSGGLLIAVAPRGATAILEQLGEPAAVIGHVRSGTGIAVMPGRPSA